MAAVASSGNARAQIARRSLPVSVTREVVVAAVVATGPSIESGQEAIAQERYEHHETVVPGNLLPLVELASGVRDRHFVDAVTHLQNSGGDLRIEAPARLAQSQLSGNVDGEDLVTGLQI